MVKSVVGGERGASLMQMLESVPSRMGIDTTVLSKDETHESKSARCWRFRTTAGRG